MENMFDHAGSSVQPNLESMNDKDALKKQTKLWSMKQEIHVIFAGFAIVMMYFQGSYNRL